MSDRLSNQWKALGTTIRYATGQAVFGMAQMVGQLKEMQVQMGLISAIGTTTGGRPIAGAQLNDLMGDIRRGAVESLTPVKDYTNAVVNLLSTVQNVPRSQITGIVTDVAQAAQLAQVSVEDAMKAFSTMPVAFGMQANQKNIHTMAQQFYLLTRLAPGGPAAGAQIIGQLGQLARPLGPRYSPRYVFNAALYFACWYPSARLTWAPVYDPDAWVPGSAVEVG
jgi:hypothetical protein